jgi:signal transduction histidine kinase
MQCYRIVQEALTNVARHADARHVNVSVVGRPAGVRLEDDGCGVSVDAKARAGIGLISMTERAREIGGELELTAGRTGGTLISLRVPLAGPGHAQ